MNQLTIFDILKPENVDIDSLPESDMVQKVSDAIGISFTYNSWFDEYMAKLKKQKLELSLCYSTYTATDRIGQRFISVGYSTKQGDHAGGGRPCDTIEEAIKYFKAILERYG